VRYTPKHRLSAVVLALGIAALAAGCGTAPPASELRAGPSVPIPSDGRLGGAWWMHPHGAKLKP